MGADTVTMVLPTGLVERRVSRGGREFAVVRLPGGTVVGGSDLSGWAICASSWREDPSRAGLTLVELPAGEPRCVRAPSGAEGGPSVEADPSELRDAIERAHESARTQAVRDQAQHLLEQGDLRAAYEALDTLLNGGGETLLPPAGGGGGTLPAKPRPDDPARAYEALGILPAFLPTCSADTLSPTEGVPERFTHVAVDSTHCVTREFFEEVLRRARSRAPQYAGALDEHGIGYVARQLSMPLAMAEGRPVAEVNGAGVDLSGEVFPIAGARARGSTSPARTRDVVELGAVSVAVDRASLIERAGMTAAEASAVAERVCGLVESEVAIMCERMGVGHLHALLRSPDAAWVLLEAGVRLENPVTGERMGVDATTGRLECELRGIGADADDPAFLDCCLLHVASDDGWRVRRQDAVRLARGAERASRELAERARDAYLSDGWLGPRTRTNNAPTSERARALACVGQPEATGARLAPSLGAPSPITSLGKPRRERLARAS